MAAGRDGGRHESAVVIVLDVLGTPAPKGSMRAIMRGGHAVTVPGSSDVGKAKLRSWDVAVREQARELLGPQGGPFYMREPLFVGIVFRLARPSGHWGTGKNAGRLAPSAPIAPATKPDADKLARATLDALHGSVYDDDSRIVELIVRKIYARPGEEGARIVIKRWEADA